METPGARPARNCVLICGHTATGKSAVAAALACRIGGDVVNADSMQNYAGLAIITAQPDAQMRRQAPHFLYGTSDPAKARSSADWLADIRALMGDAQHSARPLVIVGGTGLYFQLLTRGLADVPPVDPRIREKWRRFAAHHPIGALRRELKGRDPQMAAYLAPGDPQRLCRALEVLESSGKSLLYWHKRRASGLLRLEDTVHCVMTGPRDWLAGRIGARTAFMLAHGAEEEARALARRRLDPALPAMRAIGVTQILGRIAGGQQAGSAQAAIETATRRYARRQGTYFRNQMGDWPQASLAEQSVPEIVDLLARRFSDMAQKISSCRARIAQTA